jgi:hypothetical protein
LLLIEELHLQCQILHGQLDLLPFRVLRHFFEPVLTAKPEQLQNRFLGAWRTFELSLSHRHLQLSERCSKCTHDRRIAKGVGVQCPQQPPVLRNAAHVGAHVCTRIDIHVNITGVGIAGHGL